MEAELSFLIETFVENGYKRSQLIKIIDQINRKRFTGNRIQESIDANETPGRLPIITLPWIPGFPPKLRKAYKKAGNKTVFKSNKNLQKLLTSKNKNVLPMNSYPGVYKVVCSFHPPQSIHWGNKNENKSRGKQHEENVEKEQWQKSALALHKKNCDDDILFDEVKTLKIEHNTFNRKVREALEIQYHRCEPKYGGINLDTGKYAMTKFWMPFFESLRKLKTSRSN